MTKKQNILLESLKEHLGIVTVSCEAVNISRGSYYNWYNNNAEFREKADEILDVQLDFVEFQLIKRIKDGSDTAIIYYLNHKGKKRGYNTDNSPQKQTEPIQIEIVDKIES